MPLLIYFIFILIYLLLKRNRSITLIFVLVHIISLIGAMFIDGNYSINTVFKGYNLAYTAVILTLVLMPWIKIDKIYTIKVLNEIKVKRLTYALIISSIIPFITFIAVSTVVLLNVDDINTFKYGEGVSDSFYYSMPINVKLFILSNHLYYLSYYLIPLHFYYLAKREFALSITCFIFSLNIILFGLTCFSRSVYVHYIFIYLSFLYILFNTFEIQTRRRVKKYVVTFGMLFAGYFIYITNARFANDKLYAEIIPRDSFIQDPVIFSYFDYLSQWYYNSMYVLNSYDFETYRGQISSQSVLSLLSHFKLLDYNTTNYMNLRQTLWPKHWYMFNGLVAYSVFDYGYFFTVVLSLLYCYVILKLKPVNNSINLLNLFVMVLLIQLPLMAIFYSSVGGLMFPILFLIPVYGYLRVRWI